METSVARALDPVPPPRAPATWRDARFWPTRRAVLRSGALGAVLLAAAPFVVNKLLGVRH